MQILFLLLTACSKSGNDDKTAPLVVIDSPMDNEVFGAGENVMITGMVQDNERIVEVHFHISNNVTGGLLIDIHRNPGSSSFSFNETFQTQAGVSYKIQVIAKDDSANEGRATIGISTN